MSSTDSANVRALFVDLDISAKAEEASVDLVIDRFDQWTNSDAVCFPSGPTGIYLQDRPEAA